MLLLLLFNVPETNSVPVGVEGLQILLIVDPLFAACTHRQTSSGCKKNKEKNSSAPSQKMGQIVCFCTRAERGEARRGEARAADVTLRVAHFLFAAAHLPENESHASRHRAVLLKCKVTFHKHGSQSVSISFPFQRSWRLRFSLQLVHCGMELALVLLPAYFR